MQFIYKAFDYYFMEEFKEKKERSKKEEEIDRLKRLVEKQEINIKELRDKEIKERGKADLIYQNYELINNMLGPKDVW